ncbi:MAG: hypothetical protein CL946_05100 [Ectothiorhodospiraceae bacterium]|nr:hypothetical protein [Ectothiorhodospiraceae bacterium]
MRRYTFITALACLIVLSLSGSLLAQPEVPYLSGHVNDNADLLTTAVEQDLEARLSAYEDSTTNQIAILTIQSLEGYSIEEYSIRVAETWKLGQKDVDNGALLVISKDDRKLRIEVGYGLEASLTDATTSYIINSVIVPHFKDGDYEGGIVAGASAIVQAADGNLDTSSADAGMEPLGVFLFILIFGGVVSIFTALGLFSPGCMGWFLYAFLALFYAAMGAVLSDISPILGIGLFVVYIVGYPILKIMIGKSEWGKNLQKKMKSGSRGGLFIGSTSGWSSGSGGFSSGGFSSFSGGGGSFGGGGSSGSW